MEFSLKSALRLGYDVTGRNGKAGYWIMLQPVGQHHKVRVKEPSSI